MLSNVDELSDACIQRVLSCSKSRYDMGLGTTRSANPQPVFTFWQHAIPSEAPQVTSPISTRRRRRAIQDHELDKLFNPDFYDYQI